MSNIKTLKPGEIGYGYLVENNCGFIDHQDPRNEKIIKEIYEKAKNETDPSNYGKTIFPLELYVVLQKFDVLNQNGRIYPRAVLEPQIAEYKKIIDDRSSGGVIEHPDSQSVSLQFLSHRITDIWVEGNTVMGKILIYISLGFVKYGICSAEGDKIALYLSYSHKVGISSRSLGSIKQIGGNSVVQSDLSLICFDIVHNGSTPGSWILQDPSEASLYIESKEDSKKETLFEQQIKKMNLLL
jgi:hypothetical protein